MSEPHQAKPLTTEEVLRAEAVAIHGPAGDSEVSGKAGVALYRALNGLESAALCLSGGGIRSGAFALGVIQALATHPRSAAGAPCGRAEDSLLARFHYLSTVSGGGYIGSWLSAWRTRADFPSLWASLIGRPGGPDAEPRTIGWLRTFSNYLTPKLGVMSSDAWTDVALVVRNLILNWMIIIPFACALMLALKILAILSEGTTRVGDWRVQVPFAVLGVVCHLVALVFITRYRPSRRSADREKGAGVDQAKYLRYGLLWCVLSAVFLAQFLASDFVGLNFLAACPDDGAAAVDDICQAADGHLIPSWTMGGLSALGAAGGGALYALSWLVAFPRTKDLRDFLFWTAAGCVYGAAVAIGLFLYLEVPEKGVSLTASLRLSSVVLHIVFGVPWILLSQTVAEMVFVGLSSYEAQAEGDREWLARTEGWVVAVALGWFILMFLVFFGAVFGWNDIWATLPSWLAPLGGISGLVTALIASSGLTKVRGPAKDAATLSANVILSVAAPFFAAALILFLSIALDQLLLGEPLVPDRFSDWDNDPPDRAATLQLLAVSFVSFVAIAAISSWFININRFSLHALYRNRLVRAFLGASRDRRPDPLTGFDDMDNPDMRDLWPPRNPAGADGNGGWAPFHVVNTTLNVVPARRLSWRERRATSFTMTPLHCGYSSKCLAGSNKPVGAFRASSEFGRGITLGTAVAISGAVANPNTGYHSSPGVTFLMTLFNVRLGWWLGNPADEGKDTFAREGPRIALVPLVQETFGLTTDDRKYIYLSDGGHFENLGLHEMVRRRCRFIIISDGGHDPEFKFEDLGTAVRKIAIDLGVAIRFSKLETLKPRPEGSDVGPGHDYHAMGEIDYRAADGGTAENGIILYIKAGYHGVESAGVRAYAMANPDFPHQLTLNQWFTEAQFESYRALGFEIADGILNRAMADTACAQDPSLKAIFATLRKIADAPATSPVAAKSN